MNDLAVVVPTLNSAETLDWTLLSLSRLAAKCRLEVVVADSFSTDATPRICARWGVRMVQVEPGTMYRAINAGIRTTRSRRVTYVNSDDLVYADGYRELLRQGDREEADVTYGSADFIDSGGRHLHAMEAADAGALGSLLRSMVLPFAQPAAVFTRELFEALNGFDENYRHVSDFDFFCRAWLAGRRFTRVRMPVAAFRLSPGQLSSRQRGPLLAEADAVKRRLHLHPRALDRWESVKWKAANIPNYAGRLLRHYMLTGKLRMVRTTDVPRVAPCRSAPGVLGL